jgi:hypothetical protein
MVQIMSIMEVFRRKNSEADILKTQLKTIKEENDILLEEIRELKKLVSDIEREYNMLLQRK